MASAYGVYYYNYVAAHGMMLLASAFGSMFFGFGLSNASMMKNLSVASLTVLPDGVHMRIQLFNGKLFDVPIKDCIINAVRQRSIELLVIVNGRKMRIMTDTTTLKEKEYTDPFLLLAICHPQVHEV